MKKVLIFIFCTVLIVAVCDVLVGIASVSYVKNHSLPGRYQPLDLLIRQVEPDILLLGNSVIQNAVNPDVVKDSTNMTCYNGGISGQDIRFFETMLDCALQRYTPRVVVLGFRPEELGDGVGDGIFDVLRPYYHTGYSSIDEHFDASSSEEKLLLRSSFYRFNIVWMRIILYSLFDHTEYSPNGFSAQNVPLVFPSVRELQKADVPVKYKLDCLERMMAKCQSRGVQLFVCFTPALMAFPQYPLPCVAAAEDLCLQYGFECWADYDDPFFLKAPELFADNVHLNVNGAKVYSQLFASRLAHN